MGGALHRLAAGEAKRTFALLKVRARATDSSTVHDCGAKPVQMFSPEKKAAPILSAMGWFVKISGRRN